MNKYARSMRARLVESTGFDKFLERFRKDTAVVPASERISTADLHAVYDLIKSLRRYDYDGGKIMERHKLQIESLIVNCVLIRANEHLAAMAQEIGEELPADIQLAMERAPEALESLWDAGTGQYYNRNHLAGNLVIE